ncbi:MAG: hypothetical protein ACOYLV_17255, partial [Rubrivivax sp.]
AYIDGRGATVNLLPSPTLAVAALRFFAPHSAWEIGKDRFSVHNLTINVGGRALYGILLEANMGTTIRGVTVNDAVDAGFQADAPQDGGGVYYAQYADNTVNRSRSGMQFSTFNGIVVGKRVSANLIDNFTAVDVDTVYDFAWSSSMEILNSRNSYTPGYIGSRLLLNGPYISDVEFYRTLFNGVPSSEAHITLIGWSCASSSTSPSKQACPGRARRAWRQVCFEPSPGGSGCPATCWWAPARRRPTRFPTPPPECGPGGPLRRRAHSHEYRIVGASGVEYAARRSHHGHDKRRLAVGAPWGEPRLNGAGAAARKTSDSPCSYRH